MANQNPNTIILKGNPIIKEGVAPSAKPGTLVKISGVSNDRITYAKQSTAEKICAKSFLIEYTPTGKTIDDTYVANSNCMVAVFSAGQEAYVRKSGAGIAVGDGITPANDGTVKKASAGNELIGYAISADSNNFVKIEVL